MKLSGKVVLITDAASMSGRQIADTLEAQGATLVRNIFPKQPEAERKDVMITHADPTSMIAIKASVQMILEKYGRIDVLVHNNNEVTPASFEDCGDDQFDRALDINVKSAFLYTQAVGLVMKEAKHGSIVFVSSIHGEKPCGGAFAYSVAKGALKMLAKEMVLDMGPSNIRVNLIEAGPVENQETLFYSDMSPLYEHTVEKIANKHLGTPEDIANAVLFFAGDDCTFANGSELRLDGGFLLSYFPRRVNREAAIAAGRITETEVK